MKIIILIFCLFASISCIFAQGRGTWDLNACTFTYQSKTYNLSSIIAESGSYTWTQQIYADNSANLFEGTAPTPKNMIYQLQICGNVKTNYTSCPYAAPAYQLNADGSVCTPIGDTRATYIDMAPSGAGVMLTYAHGHYVNNVQSYTTRIYIECSSTFKAPTLEHIKDYYMFHFVMLTNAVC